MSESDVAAMATCIRADLDCSDICATTANVLSRHAGYDANVTRGILEACRTACRSCGDECGSHDGMKHCSTCAQACRRCEQACDDLLSSLG